jgi:nucleotide-binding universal stress UspA family protein
MNREILSVYRHILIATDGSVLATKAIEQGLQLAKVLNAKATAVTVTESWIAIAPAEYGVAFPIDEYEKACETGAQLTLGGVKEIAQRLGTTCDTLHVKDQLPAEGIIGTARSLGCDLIVMASHGRRGIVRLLLGSQANEVLTHSTIPVLICR